MFESLQHIADRRGAGQLEEVDTRAFVQMWLRSRLKTEGLHCVEARGHTVAVAAASPAIRQATALLEFDLAQALQAAVGFTLTDFRITRS